MGRNESEGWEGQSTYWEVIHQRRSIPWPIRHIFCERALQLIKISVQSSQTNITLPPPKKNIPWLRSPLLSDHTYSGVKRHVPLILLVGGMREMMRGWGGRLFWAWRSWGFECGMPSVGTANVSLVELNVSYSTIISSTPSLPDSNLSVMGTLRE